MLCLLAKKAFAIAKRLLWFLFTDFADNNTNLEDVGQVYVPSHHPLFLRGNSWRISEARRIRVNKHTEYHINNRLRQRARCAQQAHTHNHMHSQQSVTVVLKSISIAHTPAKLQPDSQTVGRIGPRLDFTARFGSPLLPLRVLRTGGGGGSQRRCVVGQRARRRCPHRWWECRRGHRAGARICALTRSNVVPQKYTFKYTSKFRSFLNFMQNAISILTFCFLLLP